MTSGDTGLMLSGLIMALSGLVLIQVSDGTLRICGIAFAVFGLSIALNA